MKNPIALILAFALAAAWIPSLHAADSPDKPDAAKAAPTESASAKPGPSAPAESPEKIVYTADTAYAFLKTLTGNWQSQGDKDGQHYGKGDIQMFRVSAAGSTVVNTIYPGEEHEMVSIFMRDGKDLTLTHYCALQNQPIMKFEKTDKPGVIKFVFKGGTNFDPAIDAHVHEGEIVIRDKNTVESNFVAFANGKPMPIGKTILKRVEAK